LAAPDVDLEEGGVAVAPGAVVLDALGDATRRLVTGVPLPVNRSSGSSTRLPGAVAFREVEAR
jgi:hypothetical protein